MGEAVRQRFAVYTDAEAIDVAQPDDLATVSAQLDVFAKSEGGGDDAKSAIHDVALYRKWQNLHQHIVANVSLEKVPVATGPGYLAANKIAEDLGISKWWKPTPAVERYIKTYLE